MNMSEREAIICFGDSITAGGSLKKKERWPVLLQKLLAKNYPKDFQVHNCGVGGNTTALAIARIKQDVLPLLPGIVLLEFGINDAYVFPWSRLSRLSLEEYQRNLGEIIRILQKSKGRVILIRNHSNCCTHPQGNNKDFRHNFKPYDQALVAMGKRRRIPIIDLPAKMQEAGLTVSDLVAEDGLHLSPQGNCRYAELIFAGLVHLLKKNR